MPVSFKRSILRVIKQTLINPGFDFPQVFGQLNLRRVHSFILLSYVLHHLQAGNSTACIDYVLKLVFMRLFLLVSQFGHLLLILCLLLLHALVHLGLLLLVEHFLVVGHFGIEEHLENHQFVIQVLQLVPEF